MSPPPRPGYDQGHGSCSDAPTITAVVMGFRNAPTIGDAVRSLAEQVLAEPFEILVVTSGGDGSAAVARALLPSSQVVESPARLMPGGARNAGVEAASGQVIAFLAADCVAEPGWLAARLTAHRSGHQVVAGTMTAAGPFRPSSFASHVTLFCQRLPGRRAEEVTLPDAAAHGLSFDRAVLDRLGPFDPDLRVGEDTDAARRLTDLGIHIWLEPAVRTAHRGPVGTVAMLRDHHRRGVTAARAAAGSLPLIALARALLVYPIAVLIVSGTTLRTAWRNSSSDRWKIVVSAPWVISAVAAGLAGRYRERLRQRHQAPAVARGRSRSASSIH